MIKETVMNMSYKVLLFDLDGTLLDTSAGISKSVKETLQIMRLPSLPEKTIRSFVGPPINHSLQETFHLSDEDTIRGTNLFRDLYKGKYLFDAEPYPGLYEMLDAFNKAGYRLGVATYKREDYAKRLLEHFNLARYFQIIHGCDFESRLSKTDIIRLTLADLDSRPEDAALVGDTVHDQRSAEECGMAFYAVTYGFGFVPGEPVRAEGCFDSVSGLERFLLSRAENKKEI